MVEKNSSQTNSKHHKSERHASPKKVAYKRYYGKYGKSMVSLWDATRDTHPVLVKKQFGQADNLDLLFDAMHNGNMGDVNIIIKNMFEEINAIAQISKNDFDKKVSTVWSTRLKRVQGKGGLLINLDKEAFLE